jgi:glycine cleavage system H lipoate-binding protein
MSLRLLMYQSVKPNWYVRIIEGPLNMKNQSASSVIPEGEYRCVWMDAGISEFKLCDQEFRCETCAFNMNVTQKSKEHALPTAQREAHQSANGKAMTAEAMFNAILKKRLEHLRTVDIPLDRTYSRGQFWIQQSETGSYRVGINHILANFLQPILSIVISKAPANVHRHDPFCWIVLPGGAITLRSPIEATITSFNPALQQRPGLLSAAPFTDGWIMEITAKSKGLGSVTSSTECQRLTKRTLHSAEHIFKQTFHHLQPSAGTTLFDGGTTMGTIEHILGPTIYREVINRITHFPS